MAGRTKRFFSKRAAVTGRKQERRQARPAPVKFGEPVKKPSPPKEQPK